MMKLRSMVIDADKTGVASTANTDTRITPPGQLIRRYKLDELMQLVNVALGQMSLVGPRPNLLREIDNYTNDERALLSVKPGITDFSSIVFSDEGVILEGYFDPDLAYHQLIRPWKSRLGLFYVNNRSLMMDLGIIFDTCVSIVSRQKALELVSGRLARAKAPPELVEIALRRMPLAPHCPPGSDRIVGDQPVQKQAV
jgi:lipopolysaccharide/colanic/teichoic acid biosynthesis glycosyltransferase